MGHIDELMVNKAEASSVLSTTLASPVGVVAPTLAKVAVGAGAFSPTTVVANTHYLVTGTITATDVVLPAGSKGDVICVEMASTTVAALMVTNSQVLKFTSPSKFEVNSVVRWEATTATNGSAILANAIDCDVSVDADDDLILTGATNGGPGNGSWIKFTKGQDRWRVDGMFYGAGNLTALPNVAFG